MLHDSFITLPVENLSLSDTEYNTAPCIPWDRTLFFTGLEVTVVQPSFQYSISHAAWDLIWFLFLMHEIVQGWIEYKFFILNYVL